MINLRYHIVSVVAVFLALGIGLALGSTFVDSILVNELEDQVNQLDLAQEEAVELKNQAVVERDLELQNNQALRTQIVALEDDHLAKLAELQEANDQERQALIKQAELESESTKLLLNYTKCRPSPTYLHPPLISTNRIEPLLTTNANHI